MRSYMSWLLGALVALTVTACSTSVDDLQCPYAKGTYVLDPDEHISAEEEARLDALCDKLRKEHDLETAIVVVDNIDGELFDFSVGLYNKWGLGHNDRGILLVVPISRHTCRFVTGYGAEAEFPDALLKHIGDDNLPQYFREYRYGEGIYEAFMDIYRVCTNTYKRWDSSTLRDPYKYGEGNYVSDVAGALTDTERDSVNMACQALREATGLETSVVVVDTLNDKMKNSAVNLYNSWDCSKNGKGVLMMLNAKTNQCVLVGGFTSQESVLPQSALDSIGGGMMQTLSAKGSVYESIGGAIGALRDVAQESGSAVRRITTLAETQEIKRQKLEQEKREREENEDYTITIILLAILFPFIAIYFAYYGHSGLPLRAIETFTLRGAGESAGTAIHVTDNDTDVSWTLWTDHNILWYLLHVPFFDLCFLVGFKSGDFKTFAELDWQQTIFCFLIFCGYSSILWGLMIWNQVGKKISNEIDRYARYKVVQHSLRMKWYLMTAPYIAIFVYLIVLAKKNKYKKALLHCPACKKPMSPSKEKYRPTSASKIYEVEHKLFDAEMYSCEKGHSTVMLFATNWRKKHTMCQECGGFTAQAISEDVKEDATDKKAGLKEVEYECRYCGAKRKVKEGIPKIKKEWVSGSSWSGSSSGGSSSYGGSSSGGWSSSGGSSGGGGASVSW